jgi:heme-degrading monooxygenase HmoA
MDRDNESTAMGETRRGPVQEKILRTWTFWIRTGLRDECRLHLEATKLREMNAAPGNERATAVFRDLGDGSTEVAVVSIWTSMEMIRRYVDVEDMQPSIDPADRPKLLDREPMVRHEVMTDEDVFSVLPAEWR